MMKIQGSEGILLTKQNSSSSHRSENNITNFLLAPSDIFAKYFLAGRRPSKIFAENFWAGCRPSEIFKIQGGMGRYGPVRGGTGRYASGPAQSFNFAFGRYAGPVEQQEQQQEQQEQGKN